MRIIENTVGGACALKEITVMMENLVEDDKRLSKMKVTELKNWLASREAPTKGNKAELIAR